MTRTPYYIEYNPAADGAIWTVRSPHGTSVFRTDDHEEAIAERNRLNGSEGIEFVEVTA